MAERAPCIIMGCRRTFRRDPDDAGDVEYICGKHYRLSDAALRAVRRKVRRMARRKGWTERLAAIDNRLWRKIVQQATERSFGL